MAFHRIGFALTGSFCTHRDALAVMEELAADHELVPILSEHAGSWDTRFGTAEDLRRRVAKIAGREPVTTVAEAERLPHKPKATGGTQGYHSIGDGKDEDCDIEGCGARRSGMPQEACRQSEDEETEDEQIAVGLTAELELRKTVAFNHRTDLLRGEGRYPRGDFIH